MTAARVSFLLVSLVVGAAGLGACQSVAMPSTPADAAGPAPYRLAAGDDKHGVDLALGQILEVPLYGNASTGYSWDRIGRADRAEDDVLVDAGADSLPSSSPDDTASGVVGAGSTTLYRYRAARVGQTTLRLVYRRSWQTEFAPADTVTLTVRVH